MRPTLTGQNDCAINRVNGGSPALSPDADRAITVLDPEDNPMFTLAQSLLLVAEASKGQMRHRADLEATLLGFCEQWTLADNWPDRADAIRDAHRGQIRAICNKLFPLHPES